MSPLWEVSHRMRSENPHVVYAVTRPMTIAQAARSATLRMAPSFVCCEAEAFEPEGPGGPVHDPFCPTRLVPAT